MKRNVAVALWVGGVLFHAAANATDLYGIELGKPMTYPECETRLYGKVLMYATVRPENSACFKNVAAPGKVPDSSLLTVYWPFEQGPKHASTELDAYVQDGQVVRVRMFTNGASSQSGLFAELSRKFGKPVRKETQALRNALGQRYTAIYAAWQTDEVVVIFEGIGTTADSGSVNVYTRAQFDAETARERKKEGSRPRM
jgi:hypothetical protein